MQVVQRAIACDSHSIAMYINEMAIEFQMIIATGWPFNCEMNNYSIATIANDNQSIACTTGHWIANDRQSINHWIVIKTWLNFVMLLGVSTS